MSEGEIDISERKARLSPLQYRVTQERETERPFSNQYNRFWEAGSYHCVVCDEELFRSESKFESNSGWPAFFDVVDIKKLKMRTDSSGVGLNLLLILTKPHLVRTEVSCAKCNAHLGHVFKDGPKPTGLRYCINSSSMEFKPSPNTESQDVPSDDKKVKSERKPPRTFQCSPGNICFLPGGSSKASKNAIKPSEAGGATIA